MEGGGEGGQEEVAVHILHLIGQKSSLKMLCCDHPMDNKVIFRVPRLVNE